MGEFERQNNNLARRTVVGAIVLKETVRNAALCLCWSLAFSADSSYAQERAPVLAKIEQRKERLRQEAIALFPIILEGKLEKFDHCQISNQWLSAAIDEWDARNYLGVKAHASLSAPDHGTFPAGILDPKGLHAKLFCNKDETKINDKQRFEEFKKTFLSGKSTRLTNFQWSYTFPIFNDDYTRAVVVAEAEWNTWWDPHAAGAWEGSKVTKIYKKMRNGAWVFLKDSGGSSWDGTVGPLGAAASDDH